MTASSSTAFVLFSFCPSTSIETWTTSLPQGLKKMNSEPESLKRLSLDFRTGLGNNLQLFGRHAFRKHKRDYGNRRSVINASLWDVMSTGLSRYDEALVKYYADPLKDAFYGLMEDAAFLDAITYGPNDPRKVERRFSTVRTMLERLISADPS